MLYLLQELNLKEICMKLNALSNLALDAKVITLAQNEKELLAETILHIAEVERRRLYHEFNIPSLYEYLTKHAGFPNGSAYRLMDAARLQLEVPDLASKIESGQINMTQVRLVQEASRQAKKEKRANVVQEAQASLLDYSSDQLQNSLLDFSLDGAQGSLLDFASTASSDSLVEETNLSASGGTADVISGKIEIKNHKSGKSEILESLQGLTAAESEKLIAQSFQLKVMKPLKVTKQKDGSVLVQMSFTAEQWAEIEKAKEAVSSSLPAGGYPEVFLYLAKKENATRAKEAKPRPNTATLTVAKRKSVLQRDQCCQSHDPRTGKICGSKFNLQVDHIKPRWAGGTHELENLQILCAAHNRLKYQKEAGIRRW
jgi:hypothetical protein